MPGPRRTAAPDHNYIRGFSANVQRIFEYFEFETEIEKLDVVRAATERTMALLKERRSALIAAAVTSQLDVGAAA